MDANYFRNCETDQPMLVTTANYRQALADGHEEISREQYEALISKFREEHAERQAGGVGYE